MHKLAVLLKVLHQPRMHQTPEIDQYQLCQQSVNKQIGDVKLKAIMEERHSVRTAILLATMSLIVSYMALRK